MRYRIFLISLFFCDIQFSVHALQVVSTIASKAKIDHTLDNDLLNYVRMEPVSRVQSLFSSERKPDVNASDSNTRTTALMYAVGNGNSDNVQLLLDAGARVDDRSLYDRTALMDAISRNYENIVKKLIKAGADVDAGRRIFGGTQLPLMEAARN